MANRKRKNQVIIRLTDEEYETYMKQVEKSQLTQNDFFVKCVTKKKIIVVNGLIETVEELKRIGVNLNQISKNLNSGIFQGAEKELKELREEFKKVKDRVIEVLRGGE